MTGILLLIHSGCESDNGLGLRIGGRSDIYEDYGATQIRIVGLSDISPDPQLPNQSLLNAYVDLLDAWEHKVKSPGTFRFELYEYTPRSNEPRGRRLFLWADIDIIDPDKNNLYWQDFLRTYKFELEMDYPPSKGQNFILEATFITPRGTVISDTHQIAYKPE